jgi:hypothetical protein
MVELKVVRLIHLEKMPELPPPPGPPRHIYQTRFKQSHSRPCVDNNIRQHQQNAKYYYT